MIKGHELGLMPFNFYEPLINHGERSLLCEGPFTSMGIINNIHR